MKAKKVKLILLLALLIGAAAVRLYKLDTVPASLYFDEIDLGYQARSLIETGKDYRGSWSPFFVHSVNDIRAPINAYLIIPTTLLFKTPELQVRLPAAILGVVTVALIFALIQLWTKSWTAAFLTALVFTFNPWQIQFARWSHEVIVMTVLYLLGIWFFYRALKDKASSRRYVFLLLAAVFFGFTVYTYRPMSLFAPLTILLLTLFYRRELTSFGKVKAALAGGVFLLIVVPFLYMTTLGAPDLPRINQISVFSDPRTPITVQRAREVDSGDITDATLGKKAVLSSFFFHNKPLSWLSAFAGNYYRTFSTDFLFLKGDPNPRHSVGEMGELYYIDILALFAGLFFIFRNLKDDKYRWLLVWLLISPIPAALTFDGADHAARLFTFSTPLLVTVGLGWWQIAAVIKKRRWWLISGGLAMIWIVPAVFYLHRYFLHYPIESARSFGYGFKQAATRIYQEEGNYKEVVMVPTYDPPMMYYLFWANVPPKLLQEYGTDFSEGKILGKRLDKYKVVDYLEKGLTGEKFIETMRSDTLYLLTQNELGVDLRKPGSLPRGVKLVEMITFPDKELDFYLVTKNPLLN